MSLSIKW